jgi:hypothetical protein
VFTCKYKIANEDPDGLTVTMVALCEEGRGINLIDFIVYKDGEIGLMDGSVINYVDGLTEPRPSHAK